VNPLNRLLLGRGQIDERLRAELTAADLILLEEGLTGSITYRNYRVPGQYSSWRKAAVSGAVAVTPQRLVVWAGKGKHIDIPLAGPWRDALEVTAEQGDRICFAYDAARFSPSRSGTVQVRLRTPNAARIAALLAPSRP
jgi:hypothetical protein